MANRILQQHDRVCPKCGGGLFTASGLKTHNCAARLAHPEHYKLAAPQKPLSRSEPHNAAAQKDDAGPAPTTLAAGGGADPVGAGNSLPPEIEALVSRAVRLDHGVALSLAGGLLQSALCGKTLADIKRKVKHGQWLPFCEQVLAPRGLPERTAQYHMKVWDSAKKKALKTASFPDLLRLSERPLSDLSAKEQQTFSQRTRQLCDGETASGLLAEYGLAKKSHGHKLTREGGNKGGFRPSAALLRAWLLDHGYDALVGTPFDQLPPAVQAEFRKTGKRYAARLTGKQREEIAWRERADDLRPFALGLPESDDQGVLAELLDGKHFALWEATEIERVRDLAKDLGIACAQHLARLKANARK